MFFSPPSAPRVFFPCACASHGDHFSNYPEPRRCSQGPIAPETTMPGCRFNAHWLENDKYKNWLRRGPNDRQGYCTVCKKDIKLYTMGESALTSHAKGKSVETKFSFNHIGQFHFGWLFIHVLLCKLHQIPSLCVLLTCRYKEIAC